MNELIELLESEKWYPENPTPHEIQVSYHLNRILDDIIHKLRKHAITTNTK